MFLVWEMMCLALWGDSQDAQHCGSEENQKLPEMHCSTESGSAGAWD